MWRTAAAAIMPREPLNFSGVHRVCKLVVLLCSLHISVTLIFYVRSFDIRLSFLQNHQRNNSSTSTSTARPTQEDLVLVQVQNRDQSPASAAAAAAPAAAPESPPTPERVAHGICPETSPLLGNPPPPNPPLGLVLVVHSVL